MKTWNDSVRSLEEREACSLADDLLNGMYRSVVAYSRIVTTAKDGFNVFNVKFDNRYSAQAYFILLKQELIKRNSLIGVRRVGRYQVNFSRSYQHQEHKG